MQSESIAKLITALVKVQKTIRGYKEDSKNPFFNSTYGDLSSVWAAVREPLTSNGLAVIQTLEGCDEQGRQKLRTMLAHESGEWIDSMIAIKPVKEDPQQAGSAITYARRYSLAAIVGVAPEDDDGETAMGRPVARETRQRAAQARADKEAQLPSDVINRSVEPSDPAALRPNPEYDGKESDPVVSFPAKFKTKPKSGKSLIYTIFGQDVVFPIKHVVGHSESEVCVSSWIANKKHINDELPLEASRILLDAADQGDAWEPPDYPEGYPPEGEEDVR